MFNVVLCIKLLRVLCGTLHQRVILSENVPRKIKSLTMQKVQEGLFSSKNVQHPHNMCSFELSSRRMENYYVSGLHFIIFVLKPLPPITNGQ